jgi:DNA-binding HxlR family transcriptional regulator
MVTRPVVSNADSDVDGETCDTISDMLARIGDKWSLLVVSTLGDGRLRFNELRRSIGDISQKMLSSTLKVLERDGMITRTVVPTVPPQVQYELPNWVESYSFRCWRSHDGRSKTPPESSRPESHMTAAWGTQRLRTPTHSGPDPGSS